jgi:hypothetical protein
MQAAHLRWCVCAATPGPLLWAPQSATCGPVVTEHMDLSLLPHVIAISDLQGISACKRGSQQLRSHSHARRCARHSRTHTHWPPAGTAAAAAWCWCAPLRTASMLVKTRPNVRVASHNRRVLRTCSRTCHNDGHVSSGAKPSHRGQRVEADDALPHDRGARVRLAIE